MTSWQEDLLDVFDQAQSEHEVFRRIESAARSLGLDYCAYACVCRCHCPTLAPSC